MSPGELWSLTMSGDEHGRRWWHAFGAWTDEIESVDPETGETGPSWQRSVVGPSPFPPEQVPPVVDGMTYLASWDHHPTDEEQDATDPPEVDS